MKIPGAVGRRKHKKTVSIQKECEKNLNFKKKQLTFLQKWFIFQSVVTSTNLPVWREESVPYRAMRYCMRRINY